MKKGVTDVGLDVHKNSIDVVCAENDKRGEVRHYGKIGGNLGSLEKVVRKLVRLKQVGVVLIQAISPQSGFPRAKKLKLQGR